jgi:hypothetical protein
LKHYETLSNQLDASPYSSRGHLNGTKSMRRGVGVWEILMTNKNKWLITRWLNVSG